MKLNESVRTNLMRKSNNQKGLPMQAWKAKSIGSPGGIGITNSLQPFYHKRNAAGIFYAFQKKQKTNTNIWKEVES